MLHHVHITDRSRTSDATCQRTDSDLHTTTTNTITSTIANPARVSRERKGTILLMCPQTLLNSFSPSPTCRQNLYCLSPEQGDTAGSSKPPVDFKTKVPLWPDQARPKRNFCFEVHGRFGTTPCVTLYSIRYCIRRPSLIFIWTSYVDGSLGQYRRRRFVSSLVETATIPVPYRHHDHRCQRQRHHRHRRLADALACRRRR